MSSQNNTSKMTRQVYIKRLEEFLQSLDRHNDHAYYDIDELIITIETYRQHIAKDHEFTFYDEVLESDKDSARKILEKADYNMELNLLHYSEYDVTDFDSLPFVATRSITDMEKNIHMALVENIIYQERIELLKEQLKQIDEENEKKAREKEEQEKKKLEEKRKADIELFGFPRSETIKKTKELINKVETIIGREEKIKAIRELFYFLIEGNGNYLIWEHEHFRNIVKKKLLEFRYKENLREAGVWWRRLFNTRISPN